MENIKTITVGPGTFVSSPFIKCPKCGRNSFGVLSINSDSYSRRCKECYYPQGTKFQAVYPLPKLNKKVIYIDQFAISNMMKALNPRTKAYKKRTIDRFWFELFGKLHSLCKLQLIICPDSDFHKRESLTAPFYESLKQMYELLSCGVSFYDHKKIEEIQLLEHAENWISGKSKKKLNLEVHSVIHGDINAWQSRFYISVDFPKNLDWVDDLRKSKQRMAKDLNNAFKLWQNEKNMNFEDRVEREYRGYGRTILGLYICHIKRNLDILRGSAEFTYNHIFPSKSVELTDSIYYIFKNAGIQDNDIWIKIVEYLTSSNVMDIPFLKILSMLYAALARKAASGRKEPPNQGIVNDFDIISYLLPYCDAIFIDKECHGYLKENPLCDAIDYGTKVFSLNNKEEFLDYLNDIEKNTSKEHFDKIKEVYGDNWRKPFTEMYKK